tara:strand:- start:1314 stop:2360 length:1047 start_codon:yes stop_codon:yes gene_type:complete
MSYTTINKSSDYFNTKLYTGNGVSGTGITGVGFKPDWLWTKERSSTSSHTSTDVVRGANVSMNQNSTGAQGTETQSIISFDTDGFTVGSGGGVNQSSQTYVGWNWLAGGSQGSSNTDGTINTTYTSANTTSGFSICQYTGTGANATVGHGLGVAPKMIIVKRLNTTGGWTVYHSSVGNTKYLYLNTTAAEDTASSIWNNTSPTSSVFTVGTDGEVNASGSTYIAYCFAEKQGFSKFGSYVGNGGNNNEAPFIYTGTRPSFFLVKKSSADGEDWAIYDNTRNPFNKVDEALFPSATTVETNVGNGIDFLANGIKINDDGGELNTSGATYIYYAIGQSIVGSNNVPATAR